MQVPVHECVCVYVCGLSAKHLMNQQMDFIESLKK